MDVRTFIRVPEEHYRIIHELMHYSNEKRDQVLAAVVDTGPTSTPEQLTQSLLDKLPDIDEVDISDIISFIIGIYSVKEISKYDDLNELVEQIQVAIESSKDGKLIPPDEDWSDFNTFIMKILELEESIGFIVKAINIKTDFNHVYINSKILTDLRPIFKTDPDETPIGAIVTHTLKIIYKEGMAIREYYIALNSADIYDIKNNIDRAISKEKSLRKLISDKIDFCIFEE